MKKLIEFQNVTREYDFVFVKRKIVHHSNLKLDHPA